MLTFLVCKTTYTVVIILASTAKHEFLPYMALMEREILPKQVLSLLLPWQRKSTKADSSVVVISVGARGHVLKSTHLIHCSTITAELIMELAPKGTFLDQCSTFHERLSSTKVH